MRFICCLFLLLPACTSHVVRCDGSLKPINKPAPPASAAPSVATDSSPARAP